MDILKGFTGHPISGGSITVQVYYLGVNVHTEKDNLCIRTSCPIAPGDFSITNIADLPDFTPTVSPGFKHMKITLSVLKVLKIYKYNLTLV